MAKAHSKTVELIFVAVRLFRIDKSTLSVGLQVYSISTLRLYYCSLGVILANTAVTNDG